MGVPVPSPTLAKVREALRDGMTISEAARLAGVSYPVARFQASLLSVKDGTDYGMQGVRRRQARGSTVCGSDYAAEGLDLVTLFETPRSPSQIKRFLGGDE